MRLPDCRLSAACAALGAVLAAVSVVPAAAADAYPVKAAEARVPLRADPANAPSVLMRRFAMRNNEDKVGEMRSGFLCGRSTDVRFNAPTITPLVRDILRVNRRELDAAGYGKPSSGESVFQPTNAPVTVDFELGATLREVQLNGCSNDDSLEGGVWMRMQWELFSQRQQKVVFTATTEGSAQTAGTEKINLTELGGRAIAASLRNLLADPAFVAAARKPAETVVETAAARLKIAQGAAAGQKLQDLLPMLQSGVVTLLTGVSTGSGFYISADGYLLTNQHVVGDAKYLKVKLASGRELVGEVLRSNSARDVALVKTEAVALAPLGLSREDPRSGEDVYALGSPLGESFANSLTRGVLSGTRVVGEQKWLQSDVKVMPGSSGGPLVGGEGAVLGLTSRGVAASAGGISLFIPIREALDVLKIDFKAD